MTSRTIQIVAALMLATQMLWAQNEQSLQFSNNIWQSNLTNPALVPDDKRIRWSFLPSAYFNMQSPISTNDLVRKEHCYRILDLGQSNWVNKLGEQNRFEANAQVLTNAIAFPVKKKFYVSLHHLIASDAQVDVPQAAFKVLYHGNDDFIGRTVVLDNRISASVRSELGLGVAYQYKNFSFAVRAKSQNGITAAFTDRNELRLTTDTSYYGLTLNSDYRLLTFQPNMNEVNNILSLLNDNGGYSFDLGATMKWKKFDFAVSVLDIGGKLTWQRSPMQIRSYGDFNFDGLSALKFANGGVESIADSIKSVLNFKTETERIRYIQKLPMRTYLSARYQLKEKVSVGALLYIESRPTETQVAATAYVGYTPKSWLNLGATVGYRNGSIKNIGLQTTVTVMKRLQIYFVSDNAWGLMNPAYTKNVNGRVGMNIILGKKLNTEAEELEKIEQKYGTPQEKQK